MTPEERAERVQDLREWHAGHRPHYEDADSKNCGCGECNGHLLVTELQRVEAENERLKAACAAMRTLLLDINAAAQEAFNGGEPMDPDRIAEAIAKLLAGSGSIVPHPPADTKVKPPSTP